MNDLLQPMKLQFDFYYVYYNYYMFTTTGISFPMSIYFKKDKIVEAFDGMVVRHMKWS